MDVGVPQFPDDGLRDSAGVREPVAVFTFLYCPGLEATHCRAEKPNEIMSFWLYPLLWRNRGFSC